ncbi:MAG: class C beta-lactamase-related serine hydrolase [Bacteroidia bacterium]|nr:beta-lactamase family protein [Bacteroidales bacterium]NCD40669.1 class C beta-lactamase-related serine hydrolase [Bacteroidia bacterium]MDD2322942.1 serine hydrolase [Bacteroidales bacterium]MDD3011250.1 serine hydrolase [Bacteroidales bacterium]MDD3961921.1 serine hydrolase [Bacteroidales bacterium]
MKKRAVKISLLVLATLVVTYFALPQYARTALRYGYVGIDDYTIFHNRTVEALDPSPWNQHPQYNTLTIPETFYDSIVKYKPIAFVIVKDSMLLHETYWEEYSAESLTNPFSATKSIVGILTGIAIDKGFIGSENDPVIQYIPELDKNIFSGLTLKNLLEMASGSDWNEEYSGLFTPTTAAYYGKNLEKLLLNQHIETKPGITFRYQSGNTQLLAMIISRASGITLSEFASRYFWSPVQAERDARWSLDKKNGMEKAYCCFNTNATDLARLGQLLLNNGQWNGYQVVSKTWIEKSLTPAQHLLDNQGNPVDFYGYQWWMLNHRSHTIYYARGILGQYVFVIPDMNTVMVRMGHIRSKDYIGHHPTDVYLYLDTALEMLKDQQ